jgi:hypothetical protein
MIAFAIISAGHTPSSEPETSKMGPFIFSTCMVAAFTASLF